MASRNGSDSMSPTVPPISTMTTSAFELAAAWRMRALISSVTCGMTWIVAPEEVAPALLLDDRVVHRAGGDVGDAGEALVGEALVVPEVEVRLGAVLGDEDLAVLERAHGPGVDVEVGVALLQRHPHPAGLQQGPQRRGGDPLAETRRPRPRSRRRTSPASQPHALPSPDDLAKDSSPLGGHEGDVRSVRLRRVAPPLPPARQQLLRVAARRRVVGGGPEHAAELVQQLLARDRLDAGGGQAARRRGPSPGGSGRPPSPPPGAGG